MKDIHTYLEEVRVALEEPDRKGENSQVVVVKDQSLEWVACRGGR